jgi:hypothetical protein
MVGKADRVMRPEPLQGAPAAPCGPGEKQMTKFRHHGYTYRLNDGRFMKVRYISNKE